MVTPVPSIFRASEEESPASSPDHASSWNQHGGGDPGSKPSSIKYPACDAVDAELTKGDQDWLKRKLKVAEIGENFDVSKMKKIVAGKKLWNYDNLEPTEKKGAI